MVNEQSPSEPQLNQVPSAPHEQGHQQQYAQNQQQFAQQPSPYNQYQQQYASNQYAQPGPAFPQYAPQSPYAPHYAAGEVPQSPRTSVLAIVTLVMAFVMPLAGIICGHIALRQLRTSGEAGHSLAKVGLIVSYVLCALYVLLFVVMGIIIAIAVGLESSSYGY